MNAASPIDRRETGGKPAVVMQVPAETDELAGLRRFVRGYVESTGGDPTTADDLTLVVSELATNVIEHTTSATITVTIERGPEAWMIEVADVEQPFVLSEVPTLPTSSEHTGRGLFVVRSLVDDLEVVETPTSHAVRCHRKVTR